jgi:hypothetical protein
MDRQLKSNTSKTRSHSLFRQGCMLYELIPNMPEHRLAPLRIPTQSSRRFRREPAGDSDGSQPPIPIEASHP